MKRVLSTVILTICSLSILGQSDLDALKNSFADDPKNINTLFDLINYYKTENLDSLNHYVRILTSIANDKNDEELSNRAVLKQVEGLLVFNKFDEAERLLQNVRMDSKPSLKNVDYLLAKGKIMNHKQRNDEALEVFYSALDMNNEGKLEYMVPEIYAEIASVLRANNDLENCTKYYRFAIEEAKKTDNVALQVTACIQMCKVFNGWITVNLDSSIYYGELAVKIAEKSQYERGYMNAISILSAPVIRKGQYQRGLKMSKEAFAKAEEYNFSLRDRYYLLANQGFAFEGLKMYDSALFYMEKAGDLRPGSLDLSRLQYRIFKAQGRYPESLKALETYNSRLDSTLRSRNQTRLSSLQARFEANLKEQEVAALTQTSELQKLQLDQQRYFLLALGIFILLIISGGVLLYRQRKLRQRQAMTSLELEETQKRLELERQYRASELKAIRSQMNPHFVFNALNSIQEYIMSNERKLAGKYLGKFADLMRVYLQHSQVKTVTLKEEIEALNLYLELEKLRFEDSLNYSIQIEDGVDMEISIPSLLIQPYVENAIKHGLLHKNRDRQLTIRIWKDQGSNSLLFEVTDNGIGRKRSEEINRMRNPDHKSFATGALKSRIELLNHDRIDPIVETVADLNSSAEEPGTKVLLELPVSMEASEVKKDHSEIEV